MKIGIDARELCNKPAGKGQYLWRIVAHLLKNDAVTMMLYTQPGQSVPTSLLGKRSVQKQVGGRSVLWHRNVAMQLGEDAVDVFFAALSYQSAIWNNIPTVTVVHDLAVFRLPKLHHNWRSKLVERTTLRLSLKRSTRVIAVSEATKRDLVELMGAASDSINVVYEAPMLGVDSISPLPIDEREKIVLFVGTLEPRKNIDAVLNAFAKLSQELRAEYCLKIVGKPGWGGEDYPGICRALGIESRVVFLGYQSEEDLAKLYKTARVFFYPSLYEGFGLPVIEAMSVGTPTITSNTSALPEVIGESGLMYNPSDIDGMCDALTRLLTDASFYTEQSAYLFDRSRQFSWQRASDETLAIVQEALLAQ